jgi:hypothetical protein
MFFTVKGFRCQVSGNELFDTRTDPVRLRLGRRQGIIFLDPAA